MPKRSLPHALPLVQHGLLTRDRLEARGVHGDLGDRMVRDGRWLRLTPSVYLVSSGPPDDDQLVRAAALHAGPGAVVTGLVACRALGMVDVPPSDDVEVLIPPGTRAVSTQHVRVQQTTRMPATWQRGEVSYAAPVRAAVDGARRLTSLRDVRALLCGAVCSRLVAGTDLLAEVDAGPRRGSGLVRRAAEDALAGAWSAPEAEAAELVAPLTAAGRLPPYVLNPTLLVNGRWIGRPDGWLLGAGVGWQVDSRRHHSSDDDFDRTLAVHDDFASAGLTVLHVTPRRLRLLGTAWVEHLVAAVAARPTGGGEPDGLLVRADSPVQRGQRRAPLRAC